MRHLFLLLLSLHLFAHDEHLLDLYQKEGSTAIEKIFDQQLSSSSYWEAKLENIDTRLGYFESINAILACDKNSSHLKLFTKNDSQEFNLSNDFSAYVGKRQGDKQREGDLKTPIGVYRLIQKLDDVDSFYGPLAFVTSYPNTYDQTQGKNGSGIWVHGLPTQQKRDDFTRGCIAISNEHLKQIESNIDFHETLVFIDTKEIPSVTKNDLADILAELYRWKSAWTYNDIDTYLSFYSPDFKRNDGMNFRRFRRYKERIFNKNEDKKIHFKKINILPYPSPAEKKLYYVFFTEKYLSANYAFEGDKELYIQLDNKQITILAEK